MVGLKLNQFESHGRIEEITIYQLNTYLIASFMYSYHHNNLPNDKNAYQH